MNVYQFQEGCAYIFMQSSGQQGSGPEGADVSDSGSPAPPPFEKVRDFDLWPEERKPERNGLERWGIATKSSMEGGLKLQFVHSLPI